MATNPNLPVPIPPTPENSIIERLSTGFQLAYHGIAQAAAEVRLWRSGRVIERMDHKDALYSELGKQALTGVREPVPAARSVRARGPIETLAEIKLTKRAHKYAKAKTFVSRDANNYGRDKSRPQKSTRQAVIDRALWATGAGPANGGVIPTLYRNIERKILGPGIEGYSGSKRKWEHTKNNVSFMTGQKSYQEKRARSMAIRSHKLKLGNQHHLKSRSQLRKKEERLELAVSKPISSRVRDSRRRRAINRAVVQHNRVENHKQKIASLRS